MREEEVPQDIGALGGHVEICYAQNGEGRVILARSQGWDPANLANLQAWEEIGRELEGVVADVRAGRASPLAFHMHYRLMDVGMLAAYTGQSRWRVKKQLKPKGFAALTPEQLSRYADLFQIPLNEISQVPEQVVLPVDLTSGNGHVELDD